MSDERSERIEAKIDKLAEAVADLRVSLATDKEAKKDITRRVGDLEKEVKPIKRHVAVMHGVGLVGGLVGFKALMAYLLG